MTPKQQLFGEIADLMPELVPMPGMVATTLSRTRAERNGEAAMLRDAESKCELLQAQVEELQARYDAAADTAVVFAEGIVTLHAQNEHYRAALLAVVGTDNHEDAVQAAQEGLSQP